MGRTKSYDRDEVITLALPTFWAVGYHATGVAALEESMGINKFSIYAEFGSKHGLFLATIDHFIRVGSQRLLSAECRHRVQSQ
jgi:TetR/AcrR family transcriptional repressor of nem operon